MSMWSSEQQFWLEILVLLLVLWQVKQSEKILASFKLVKERQKICTTDLNQYFYRRGVKRKKYLKNN